MRANYTYSRLPPPCRLKPIVLLARRLHDWQGATGTSHLRVNFGKAHLGNSCEGYEAYEQLAIYYEHEAREPATGAGDRA